MRNQPIQNNVINNIKINIIIVMNTLFEFLYLNISMKQVIHKPSSSDSSDLFVLNNEYRLFQDSFYNAKT